MKECLDRNLFEEQQVLVVQDLTKIVKYSKEGDHFVVTKSKIQNSFLGSSLFVTKRCQLDT